MVNIFIYRLMSAWLYHNGLAIPDHCFQAHLAEVTGTSRSCSLSTVSSDEEEPVIDGLTAAAVCPCYKVVMNPRLSRPENPVSS